MQESRFLDALGAAVMVPAILGLQQAAPTFETIQNQVESMVAGKPFSVRMRMLRDVKVRNFDQHDYSPGARIQEVLAHALRRGAWPTPWRLDREQDDPPAFSKDPGALEARFICYGDTWPRERQTSTFLKLGGAKADRRVQVWYALFPSMYGPSLKGLDDVQRVATRFPDRWEPLLVRYGFVRTLYLDWTFKGFPRRIKIPLAVHQTVKREVDLAYRITTRMYGPDAAWNVSCNQELDLWRKKAGQ